MENSVNQAYQSEQPQRSEVDALAGVTALDFGTDWCGHCKAGAGPIAAALAAAAAAGTPVRHLKVEDGSGRKLGRSFKVKLWPTVVVLKDGIEVARVVRPLDEKEVAAALAAAS